MNITGHLATAFGALRANLLRSMLTTLGVVIGVASVIVMAAVGSGAQQSVETLIKSLGTNLLNIAPGTSRLGGRAGGAGTALPFSDSDVNALRLEIPDLVGVTGLVTVSGPVVYGNANWLTYISGVNESYPDVQDWEVAEGRFYDAQEVKGGAKVVVLGASVAKQLFGGASPVGQQVRISKVPFEVIGVLAEKGQTAVGRDRDDLVVVPITTARSRLLGKRTTVPNQVQRILLKASDGADLSDVQRRVIDLLRTRRHLAPGAEDDFTVRNYAEIVQARTATQRTLAWLLAATAAVSLIVGGIGIMNIMLVSVTERTREIGLRMAIGARPLDIMIQFLIEAVALCTAGGVLGVVIGLLAANVAATLASWPIVIGAGMIGLALASSATVGVVFGYLPARRAAALNPIDALRYE